MESAIMQTLITYELPALFWGSFFFAEIVIIAAAFLAGQGVWSVTDVFLLSLAGTLVADSVWFFLGRKLFHQLNRWEYTRVRYERFSRLLNHIASRRSLSTFLIMKFLYGTRMFMAMHFSASRLPFRRFIVQDTIATVIWLCIIMALGWFAGRGLFGLGNIGGVQAVVAVLIFLLIVYRFVNVWFNKKVLTDDEDADAEDANEEY